MIGIIIALVVVLGAGGTVVVSDNSRPGDVLFGIDQAVEKVRLSFASNEKKGELRIQFAEERVEEIEDIVKDDSLVEDDSTVSVDISDLTVSEIEADIFTNETVVKIEYNDRKTLFTTESKTRETIVVALIAQYPALTRTFIEKIINIESEDRTSQDNDKVVSGKNHSLTDKEQVNVNAGIELALNLLTSLKEQQQEDSRLDDVISKLNAYVDDLPSDARIEISDDKLKIKFENDESEKDENDDTDKVEIKKESNSGDSKSEIRTDEESIKIEVKDGVLEIKTKLNDDNDDDDNVSDKSSIIKNGLEEAEAKIFSDKTIVEVEVGDEKTTFTTSATTRASIIAAIVVKFPSLTTAQVEAVLEIETEDESDSSDDDNNDNSNKDDDSDRDKDDGDNESNSDSRSN